MYLTLEKKSPSMGTWERTFLGPRFKMADTVLEQIVDSTKIPIVNPHLQDNLMQIPILTKKDAQNW